MEKISHSQLELFSQIKGYNQVKKIKSNSFLNYLWNYEKVIFIIIGFIITGTVSFSLGVEKGKKNVATKMQLPTQKQEAPVKIQPQKDKQIIIQNQPEQLAVRVDILKPNYTIQIASYQTKTYAQKEAELLRKKGFLPLVLPKGRYTIVCVGNFSNEKMAKSLLSELKKRYQDCFIRRL